MKSLNNNQVKVGDQFHYWKVLALRETASALCLCTGCNKTQKDLWFCKLLKGTSKSCGCKNSEFRKQKALEKYGVENISQAEIIKQQKIQTTLRNLGVPFPMQSKQVMDKSKQTLLDRWGVEHNSQHQIIKQKKSDKFSLHNQQIQENKKAKFIELYGVENYLSSKQNRKNITEIFRRRYGVDNPSQSDAIKDKKKQTSLSRYGTDHPQQSPSLRLKKILDPNNQRAAVLSSGKSLSLLCDEIGIKNKSHAYNLFRLFGEEVVTTYLTNYKQSGVTDLESKLIEITKPYFNDIAKYNKKPLEQTGLGYRPDFRLQVEEKVLYVNVDGLYYHSELMIEDKNYHFDMRKAFEKSSLRLMQFRADELLYKSDVVRSIILSYFGIYQQKFSARECTISPISKEEADHFFIKNHLMGTHSAFKSWGLKLGQKLVCCLAVREFNQHIEICRFGSLLDTSVRGGFSKLLAYVDKLYNKTIISYCDLRYAEGTSYYKLGFKLQSTSLGWQWTDLKEVFNRYYCRASMDSRKLSEREYASELKIYKIYDAGQGKFVKIR